jgi:hypothetical protein
MAVSESSRFLKIGVDWAAPGAGRLCYASGAPSSGKSCKS